MIILCGISFKAYSQTVELISSVDLKEKYSRSDDTLYILNFWATWCKPCIEELPYFERINEEYKEKNVKLYLVNLDFHSKVESSVKPFMSRKNIKSSVIHVTDTDPNEWIDKIEKRWSGAIPATVMYKSGKSVFFKEGTMTYEELKETVDRNLQ